MRAFTQINARAAAGPWRNLLVSAHVLTTVGAFGADLVLVLLAAASILGADPRTVYPAAFLVGQVLLQPLALLSLLSGLILTRITPWGLLRYWWTAIKLAITFALTLVVWLVLVPHLAGDASATLAAPVANRLPLLLAPALGSLLLVVNVVLSVFKPRWRLRHITNEAQSWSGREQSTISV